MIFDKFRRHFDSNRMAMYLFAGYSALATAAIFYLSASLATVKTTVRIIPFGADKSMVIAQRSANGNYYKFWGMDFALALGNLTPYNAKFVEKQILPYVKASQYQEVKSAIESEAASELSDNVVTTFTPHSLVWQPQSGTVFVTGQMNEVSPNGRYTGGYMKTYQMQMRIVNGLPVISGIQLYPGKPHTLSWMKLHTQGSQ